MKYTFATDDIAVARRIMNAMDDDSGAAVAIYQPQMQLQPLQPHPPQPQPQLQPAQMQPQPHPPQPQPQLHPAQMQQASYTPAQVMSELQKWMGRTGKGPEGALQEMRNVGVPAGSNGIPNMQQANPQQLAQLFQIFSQ
jgi:hypothetical protein